MILYNIILHDIIHRPYHYMVCDTDARRLLMRPTFYCVHVILITPSPPPLMMESIFGFELLFVTCLILDQMCAQPAPPRPGPVRLHMPSMARDTPPYVLVCHVLFTACHVPSTACCVLHAVCNTYYICSVDLHYNIRTIHYT